MRRCCPTCTPTPSRGRGRRASASWSASADGSALRLVRAAKRMAERREAPWIAVHVETHRHGARPKRRRTGGARPCAWPNSWAATPWCWPAPTSPPNCWPGRGRKRQPDRRRPRARSRLASLWTRRLTDDLLARSEDFDVLVVGGAEDETPRRSRRPTRGRCRGVPLAVATCRRWRRRRRRPG